MQINATPRLDTRFNTTGCCPKFNPEGWDHRELHFRDKLFVRVTTKSAMYVPLDQMEVFSRIEAHLHDAAACPEDRCLVLSRDLSPWMAEHLFAVDKPVDGEEMATLSGDFVTRLFEGPYSHAPDWLHELEITTLARGKRPGKAYLFYTTCPKCAQAYGENYVVGFVEL